MGITVMGITINNKDMKNIDITHLITEQEIINKHEYFLEYTGEGDPVEQLIYMFWEGEEGYGNPYDLTEQEHDDLIRPVLEEYFINTLK